MGTSPGTAGQAINRSSQSEPTANRGVTNAAKAATDERRAHSGTHTGTRRPLQANAEPARKVLGGSETERAGQSRLPQGSGQAEYAAIGSRLNQSLASNFAATQPSTPTASRPVAVPTGATASKGVTRSTLPASTASAQQRMAPTSGGTPPQARPMSVQMPGQQPWLANRGRSGSPGYIAQGGGQYAAFPQTA